MASQFRVEKVVGQEPWESNFGPMLEWLLVVRDLSSDRSGNVSVNSKPENVYNIGDVFWAEHKGQRNGVAKLKRVQPPPGAGAPAKAPVQGLESPAPAPSHDRPSAVSYERALEVYKRCAKDLDRENGYEHTYATTLFLAWLNGKISDPQQEGPF